MFARPSTRVAVKCFFRQLSSKTQDQSLRLQILAAALNHVPKTGWTDEALALGAVESGFSPATHGIFQRGPIELVEYFMEESAYETSRIIEERSEELLDGKSNEERMVTVIELRLDQLKPYINNWSQAMSLGLHPNNSTTTIRNLALLADEMCHTIQLSKTDINWYCDRAIIGSVYAAAEIFMLSDQSNDFSDTSEFVKRRISEAHKLSLSSDNETNMDEKLKTMMSAIPHMSKPLLKTMKNAMKQAKQDSSEGTSTMLTNSAQMFVSTLSSILPTGYPPQRDQQSNPRKESNKGPIEEDIASTEEIENFDREHKKGFAK